MELIERYKLELEIDTNVDETNIKEVQLKLPGIKHKWVARLIQAKADLYKLQQVRSKALEKIKIKPPIDLNTKQELSAASKNDIIVKIDAEIVQQEIVIDYLSRVEVIMKSLTYDIKNVIEIMKMETM